MRSALTALCVLALAGCGRMPFGGQENDVSAARNTSVSSTGTNNAAPVVVPPGADRRPLLPGQMGGTMTPDGLPALQPARGVKLETLFAEDIRDPIERVKRVENAVVELRRDFDSVLPAIVRLTAVEGDMQELLGQLETLLRNEPPATAPSMSYGTVPLPSRMDAPATVSPAAQSAPVPVTPQAVPQTAPQPVATAQAPPPAPVTPGTTAVTALRTGEHGDKTRLVLDVTGPANYRHDLDNSENLMVIELPGTKWNAAQSMAVKSPIVQSYSVQSTDDGGSRVILQLKKAANVAYEGVIKPDAGNNHYRIVIDLK